MPKRPLSGLFPFTAGFVLVLTSHPAGAGPQEEQLPTPGDAKKPKPEANALTPDEQDRVREVFSEVWSEPDVAAAREAVHQATVKYRETIKAAVERADPSVVPLLEKMHHSIKSSAGKHRLGPGAGWKWPGGGPPPPPLPQDPKAALQRILEHDPGFEALDPAGRKRFLALADEAMQKKELQDLLDAAIRAKEPPADAAQARRKFRESLFRSVAKRDPWAEQVLRHSASKDRKRPESPSPGAQPPDQAQRQDNP